MKKIEFVYRELVYQAMEKKTFRLTQAQLAADLKMSLSTVNLALEPLRRMNAIAVLRRGLVVKDVKKVLYYWASVRNLEKDVVYASRSDKTVRTIEAEMPAGAVFAGFSAFKFRYKDVPADYSEVYVYADESQIKKRFSQNALQPNIIVLEKDDRMDRYGNVVTAGQLFVDLWNMKQWYAKEFLSALEVRLDGILA
ncbi:MAG: hypothetical protein ABIJ21_04135 [Nanoarchaeota archaeon]